MAMNKAIMVMAGIILYIVIVWKLARFVGAFCGFNDREVDKHDDAHKTKTGGKDY